MIPAMSSVLRWLAIPCLATPVWSQTLLAGYDGQAGSRQGEVFDTLGDLNGDGGREIIVGFPDDTTAGVDAGRVVVLSSVDGSTIYSFQGAPQDRIGTSVSGAGDVNADGTPDFMFGSPSANGRRGAMWVHSGLDGSLIHFQRGLRDGDDYALALDAAGDVDGDGFGDYTVGVPGRQQGGFDDHGEVWVYSGATQARLFVLTNPSGVPNRFGTLVSYVGDADGDGLDDVLAGSDFEHFDVPGIAALYAAADLSFLYYDQGEHLGHGFLDAIVFLEGTGDVDQDGHADFLVGRTHNLYESSPTLHSGLTGNVIREFPLTTWSQRFANVGDTNGDGHPDLAAFVEHFLADKVAIYSGLDGAVLQSVVAPDGSPSFGAVLAAMGDVDGDGFNDFALSRPSADGAGTDSGRIEIWAGSGCGLGDVYCIGWPNSVGSGARMSFDGTTSILANDLLLRATDCPTGQAGLFYYAPNRAQFTFGDGVRCAGGGFFRLPLAFTNSAGEAQHHLDYSNPPSPNGQITAGATWNFQYLYRDPMGPMGTGFNGSDGLALTFCP